MLSALGKSASDLAEINCNITFLVAGCHRKVFYPLGNLKNLKTE